MSTRFKILTLTVLLFSFLLRFYKVDSLPHHLYFDEVSIGWNAYSILKTGYDEHGKFLPLWFKAFGEYKLPVYVYLTSLSEAFLGKTELAVRLPSVLAGTFSVGLFILILKGFKLSNKFSFLAGFFLSISPWHIHFSRGGFEANLALFFVLLGVYFFLKAISYSSTPRESIRPSPDEVKATADEVGPPLRCLMALFLPLIFLILTLYTYNAQKIFTPLFVLSLVFIFRASSHRPRSTITHLGGVISFRIHSPLKCLRRYLLPLLILFFLTLPVLTFSFSKEGLIRATSESFIQEVKIKPDDFFQNLPFLQFEQFLKNYASYFSFDFLFLTGDQNGRHSIREMGENYFWQMPFFLLGLYYAFKRKSASDKLFLSFLFLSPLAGSFSRPSPHALRSLGMVVPVIFFTSMGIHSVIPDLKEVWNKSLKLLMVLMTVFFLLNYLHIYYVHYPKRTAPDWTGGYKDTVEFLTSIEKKYNKILLTDKFTNSYIYLLFYGNYKPYIPLINHFTDSLTLKDAIRQPLGLLGRREPKEEMYTIGKKYKVVTSPYTKDLEENMLYLAPPWEKRPEKIVKTIYDSSGNEVFTIWEK